MGQKLSLQNVCAHWINWTGLCYIFILLPIAAIKSNYRDSTSLKLPCMLLVVMKVLDLTNCSNVKRPCRGAYRMPFQLSREFSRNICWLRKAFCAEVCSSPACLCGFYCNDDGETEGGRERAWSEKTMERCKKSELVTHQARWKRVHWVRDEVGALGGGWAMGRWE